MSDIEQTQIDSPTVAETNAEARPPAMVKRKVLRGFEAHPWPEFRRTEYQEGRTVDLPEDIAASADAAGLTGPAD